MRVEKIEKHAVIGGAVFKFFAAAELKNVCFWMRVLFVTKDFCAHLLKSGKHIANEISGKAIVDAEGKEIIAVPVGVQFDAGAGRVRNAYEIMSAGKELFHVFCGQKRGTGRGSSVVCVAQSNLKIAGD